MACSIDSVNEQIKMIPDLKKTHAEGIKERDDMLFNVWGKLGDIMEEMGNLINNHDCLSPIDVRATREAFNIVVSGKDDVNK
jgi:hypothetical protein